MILSLSSWAEQIIIAVLIATIFEMIIPDCKNKKYVKTVIGLYILFTILTPVIKSFSNGNINFEEGYLNITDKSNASYTKTSDLTNNSIEQTYILSLKQDIKNKLLDKGYIASQIKINIESKNEENYGKINSLSFDLSKKIENNDTNNSISINKVEIKNNSKTQESRIDNIDIKEIKDYLYSEYGVSTDNIKIN